MHAKLKINKTRGGGGGGVGGRVRQLGCIFESQ